MVDNTKDNQKCRRDLVVGRPHDRLGGLECNFAIFEYRQIVNTRGSCKQTRRNILGPKKRVWYTDDVQKYVVHS